MSNRKVIEMDDYNLKKLMVHPLPVIQTATEKIVRRLKKEDLCSWLSFLPRAVSWDVLDELVEKAGDWEEISQSSNEMAKRPKLTVLEGGKI